jgi:surface antigen
MRGIVRILFSSAVLASLAAVVQAPVAVRAADPIEIDQCFITQPKAMSKKASGTQIVWTNKTSSPVYSVTFSVGYKNSDQQYLRRVTDVGDFAPGTRVDHHFSLYNDVTYGGKTATCHVLSYK